MNYHFPCPLIDIYRQSLFPYLPSNDVNLLTYIFEKYRHNITNYSRYIADVRPVVISIVIPKDLPTTESCKCQ